MAQESGSMDPLAVAAAPGKIILMGEHAVVHGLAALAVPVRSVAVTAAVYEHDGAMVVESRLGLDDDGGPDVVVDIPAAGDDDPVATAIRHTLEAVGFDPTELPPWRIEVQSTVPVRGGMGSSAALAVALVRAIGRAAGSELDDTTVSALAFQAERRTHGSPSGIDNAVVTLERPIRFAGGVPEPLAVQRAVHLIIADAGPGPTTREMVEGVALRRAARPATYDQWFARIDGLVRAGAAALESGDLTTLGRHLDANHLVLQAMRVSAEPLDTLVAAARRTGAYGAKLSGAGGGGIVIALVAVETLDDVEQALREAGALRVMHAVLEPDGQVTGSKSVLGGQPPSSRADDAPAVDAPGEPALEPEERLS